MGRSSEEQPYPSRREFLEAQAKASPPDPATEVPVEIPASMSAPPSLEARLQRFVRYEMSVANRDSGLETFEEFDDFDVQDDAPELVSEHEFTEMVEELEPWDEASELARASSGPFPDGDPSLGPLGGPRPSGAPEEPETAPNERPEAQAPSSVEATQSGPPEHIDT